MAAFTSKATGNWSAGGQTTWNEVGVPGFNDSATINSPHTVTVDVDTTVGDGTASTLAIASGGILSIAASVTLTVYGGIDNAGEIDEDVSSVIAFYFADTPFFPNTSIPQHWIISIVNQ